MEVFLKNSLKTTDTIGNCQNLVFSLGTSQHNYALNNKPVNILARLVIGVARQL